MAETAVPWKYFHKNLLTDIIDNLNHNHVELRMLNSNYSCGLRLDAVAWDQWSLHSFCVNFYWKCFYWFWNAVVLQVVINLTADYDVLCFCLKAMPLIKMLVFTCAHNSLHFLRITALNFIKLHVSVRCPIDFYDFFFHDVKHGQEFSCRLSRPICHTHYVYILSMTWMSLNVLNRP